MSFLRRLFRSGRSAPPARARRPETTVRHDDAIAAARKLLEMVSELHRLGYERLRIAPYLAPSGMWWRCQIVPASAIRADRGAIRGRSEPDPEASYSNSEGTRYFEWEDAEHDGPAQLAEKFVARFPRLAERGRGSDPAYLQWFSEMMAATSPNGLVYAFADFDVPEDELPVFGGAPGAKVPAPPPGEDSQD